MSLKSGVTCPHCSIAFTSYATVANLQNCAPDLWQVEFWTCPTCDKSTIELVNYKRGNGSDPFATVTLSRSRVYPKSTGRPPVPSEVPADIAKDYSTAGLIRDDSAEAAAAMARRCLQLVIRTAAGIQKKTLHDEIDELLKGNTLPGYLAEQVDAIRHFGNFGAHPEKFQNTGQLVPVEDHEVEWTLELLESLFDFYYVAPAKAQQRMGGLNAKLAQLGKPQLKKP